MQQNDEFILAPLHGVTSKNFRNALANTFGGIDRVMAPYVEPKQNKTITIKELDELSPQNNSLPIEAQILAKDAALFLAAAQEMKSIGVQRVNLNMGCPYPMVTNKGKGSSLLENPSLVAKLLMQIKKNSPLSLSVKLRLGYKDPNEIFALIPIFNDLAITDITIHPRIGIDLYHGPLYLDHFKRCVDILAVVPSYNGDITSTSMFSAMKEKFPTINRWMIGRGALLNPAFFCELRGEKLDESEFEKKFWKLHDTISENILTLSNGKSFYLHRMKEYWSYWIHSFQENVTFAKKIKKCKTIEEYDILCNYHKETKRPR
ncbi:MAG: tRNA-dihydrouridine synthase family protein [Oligoflexia bacterium]|nr:tRNA-dihydrouridine synthase family protein [Oligoflexia bacterium]